MHDLAPQVSNPNHGQDWPTVNVGGVQVRYEPGVTGDHPCGVRVETQGVNLWVNGKKVPFPSPSSGDQLNALQTCFPGVEFTGNAAGVTTPSGGLDNENQEGMTFRMSKR